MLARSALSTVAALGLMATTLSSVGCGDSATEPGQEFLGTWHYDDASGVVTCMDGNTINVPPKGNKTFEPGPTSGIVDVTVSPLDSDIFCNFKYSIANHVATATAGQVCALTGGDTFSMSGTDEYSTFTLTSPTNAEELSVGTINIPQAGALGEAPTVTTCRYDLIGHLTKVAKD